MSKELKMLGIGAGVGAIIGTLTGFGLSFTALSPLIIGGIIGFSPVAAFIAAYFILASLGVISKCKETLDSRDIIEIIAWHVIAATVGVACSFAINPDIMSSNIWMAAVTGAVIGAVGMVLAIIASECIVEPVVTKVTECFSKEASVNQLHI